jgi:hypothetical protein
MLALPDEAGAGVMFPIDTETGFPRTVLIDAAWGLGETVVQGMMEPDEYHMFKPLIDQPAVVFGADLFCGSMRSLCIAMDAPTARFDPYLSAHRWS